MNRTDATRGAGSPPPFKPAAEPREFILRLRALPGNDCPERMLRLALKRLLRSFQFKCTGISPVESKGGRDG